MPPIARMLVAYAIITVVVLVSERSRTAAGILSTAPINVPIILWLLWSGNRGDTAALANVSRSMLVGIVATVVFIAVCWLGFSRRWPLPATLLAGYAAWAITAAAPVLGRWLKGS